MSVSSSEGELEEPRLLLRRRRSGSGGPLLSSGPTPRAERHGAGRGQWSLGGAEEGADGGEEGHWADSRRLRRQRSGSGGPPQPSLSGLARSGDGAATAPGAGSGLGVGNRSGGWSVCVELHF